MQSTREPSIPPAALIKLFDYTGNSRGGNKGYFLFYVDSEGDPSLVTRFMDSATEMSLMKALEVFVDKVNSEE